MILHFMSGKIAKVKIQKQTKKYTTIYCYSNTMYYRVNNETGEVQDNTYHNVIKGLYIE